MENKIKWREGVERPKKESNLVTICFTPPYKEGCGLPIVCLKPANENEPFDIVFTGPSLSGEMVNFLIRFDDEPTIGFLKYWLTKMEELHKKGRSKK